MCVKVTVPATGVTDGDVSTATVKATSVGSPTVSGSATVKTIAVTKDTLLVDEDGNGPDVQSFYSTALTAAGVSFSTWDLATDPTLPLGYLQAHKNVIWFTGQHLPGPARAVRERAEGVPRRRREPADVRTGHPRPGGRDDARSSTTTCTSRGTAPRPRTTRRPRPYRRHRQPGRRRERERSRSTTASSVTRSGRDHAERHARPRRSRTTASQQARRSPTR